MSGKDEDTLKPHSILSFLGLDNFLRTFVLLYGEWKEYPSLYLGMDVLQDIFLYRNIVNYKEIKKQFPVIYGCEDQRAWLSSLPLSDNFISIMGNENNSLPILLDIHKGKY